MKKYFLPYLACIALLTCAFIGQQHLTTTTILLGFGTSEPTNSPAQIGSLFINPHTPAMFVKCGTNSFIATNGWQKLDNLWVQPREGLPDGFFNILTANDFHAGAIACDATVSGTTADFSGGSGLFDNIVANTESVNVITLSGTDIAPTLARANSFSAGHTNATIAVTGTVHVNFAQEMPDTNYVAFLSAESGGALSYKVGTKSVGGVDFNVLAAFTGNLGYMVRGDY